MTRSSSPREGSRRCTKCGEVKPAEAYGAGDAYRCLECISARIALWRMRKRQASARGEDPRQESVARAARRPRPAPVETPGLERIRLEIQTREQRARELRQRARSLESERINVARQLAILEGTQEADRAEAERLEREVARLDRQLVRADSDTADRDYVRTEDLARILEPEIAPRGGIVAVAQRAGVDRRALRGILTCERPLTTLRLADQVCTRLGLDLSDLEVISRRASVAA